MSDPTPEQRTATVQQIIDGFRAIGRDDLADAVEAKAREVGDIPE